MPPPEMEEEKQETEPTTPPEAPPEVPPPEEKKEEEGKPPPASSTTRKYKVDGHEVELTQEEADLYAQKGFAAEKRFQEAAQMKTDVAQVLNYLTKDQKAALTQIFTAQAGGDRDKGRKLFHDFLVSNLAEFMEEDTLSPEQKSLKAKEAELARKEAEIKAHEERMKALSDEREQKEIEDKLAREVPEAMKKIGIPEEMPDGTKAEKRIYEYLLWADDNDFPLTIEQAAREVKREFSMSEQRAEARRVKNLETSSFEELKTKFPETYKKFVEGYQKEIRQGTPTQRTSTRKDEAPQKGGTEGRNDRKVFQSMDEYSAALEERLRSVG